MACACRFLRSSSRALVGLRYRACMAAATIEVGTERGVCGRDQTASITTGRVLLWVAKGICGCHRLDTAHAGSLRHGWETVEVGFFVQPHASQWLWRLLRVRFKQLW